MNAILKLVLSVSLLWSAPLSQQAAKAIKEAENLSLLKDRLPACTVLVRTIKKSEGLDASALREKLNQLAKFFYTDKGFQDFLAGKEFFEKQKYNDASEKFTEADDAENGNTDVLHYLTLAQLAQKSGTLAQKTNRRALQMNPFDTELLRDQVAVDSYLENWPDVIKNGRALVKDHSDNDPITLQNLGLALWSSGSVESKDEGEKILSETLDRASGLPKLLYWQGTYKEDSINLEPLEKYVAICSAKNRKVIDRDFDSCTHLAEAQKILTDQKHVSESQSKKGRP